MFEVFVVFWNPNLEKGENIVLGPVGNVNFQTREAVSGNVSASQLKTRAI